MNLQRIVYSLSVEDLQTVAQEVLDRQLTSTEVATVADKLGDYIPWFNCIETAILGSLPKKKHRSQYRAAQENR